MAKRTKGTKKRVVKIDPIGKAFIRATFNNIIISLTNETGQVISWASSGKMGFRGSKKNTPYAAQMASEECGKVAYDLGLRKVKVYVKDNQVERIQGVEIKKHGLEKIKEVDIFSLKVDSTNGFEAREAFIVRKLYGENILFINHDAYSIYKNLSNLFLVTLYLNIPA